MTVKRCAKMKEPTCEAKVGMKEQSYPECFVKDFDICLEVIWRTICMQYIGFPELIHFSKGLDGQPAALDIFEDGKNRRFG